MVIDTIGFDAAALPSTVYSAVVLAAPGHTTAPPPKGTVWAGSRSPRRWPSPPPSAGPPLDAAQAAFIVTGQVAAR